MRWVESLANGNRHWYLAALELDRQFWGYVHIRTNELTENRSFVGQLDELKYIQLRAIVDRVIPNINERDGKSYDDGVLGLGTRSEFTPLIRFRSGSCHLPNYRSFTEIVSILQPELRIASDLAAG